MQVVLRYHSVPDSDRDLNEAIECQIPRILEETRIRLSLREMLLITTITAFVVASLCLANNVVLCITGLFVGLSVLLILVRIPAT